MLHLTSKEITGSYKPGKPGKLAFLLETQGKPGNLREI